MDAVDNFQVSNVEPRMAKQIEPIMVAAPNAKDNVVEPVVPEIKTYKNPTNHGIVEDNVGIYVDSIVNPGAMGL